MALKAVYEGRGSVGTVPRQTYARTFLFSIRRWAMQTLHSFAYRSPGALHFRWVTLRIAGNALTIVVTYLNLGGFAKLAGYASVLSGRGAIN